MVLNKYHRNIILSEAMIPVLHYFEILLRNRIDKVIKKYYGEDWLIHAPLPLINSSKDIKKISEIIDKFSREQRKFSHDTVLSQMTFGFWCAFFHKRYDPLLWHRKNALKSIFPHLPKKNRTRGHIEQKLLKIKSIRNRIAHHEPVWNHPVSVDEVHQICCELIKAMSPNALDLLSKIDCFLEVRRFNQSDEMQSHMDAKERFG
ncbi:MAG: Abi family protein [Alphaproteobacteria bacterium]|nr:Abi family protein [Alphaproteobacteria bacterium]